MRYNYTLLHYLCVFTIDKVHYYAMFVPCADKRSFKTDGVSFTG